jgi:hypothetical protein
MFSLIESNSICRCFLGRATAGTVLLLLPGLLASSDWWSALLYTVGSFGFLFVDVQEFFTFSGLELRTNISLSAFGSALYVIGSVVCAELLSACMAAAARSPGHYAAAAALLCLS